ncbi:MarR family winged helix-turn-helix transcriptional regulator [Kutzneria albida]|uniref:HTH marR-type domain-containing protein n=1 Tax=Kutzneria albida DSM 43870 TaxID=1449976 RepID=W5WJW4_9PSEU|nr:MarR family winged helix-turn-helix transcriptional regulator [Kutzneria albida]AHI01036.1 hypothetical protein KALB_7678 [Kutzneria albida DSM 43870]
MPRPSATPIGIVLTRTAKAVSRAFDERLGRAGGSAALWQVLLALKTRQVGNQRELAEAVGIQGATLTHHLNAMEADGLITRERDPDNRRVHLVRLTARGDQLFHQLRGAALAHDRQLRSGLDEQEVATLARLLDRLRDNVSDAG